MGAVQAFIEAALPGVFVHSIATGRSEVADIMSSYFGNLNEQVRGYTPFPPGASKEWAEAGTRGGRQRATSAAS